MMPSLQTDQEQSNDSMGALARMLAGGSAIGAAAVLPAQMIAKLRAMGMGREDRMADVVEKNPDWFASKWSKVGGPGPTELSPLGYPGADATAFQVHPTTGVGQDEVLKMLYLPITDRQSSAPDIEGLSSSRPGRSILADEALLLKPPGMVESRGDFLPESKVGFAVQPKLIPLTDSGRPEEALRRASAYHVAMQNLRPLGLGIWDSKGRNYGMAPGSPRPKMLDLGMMQVEDSDLFKKFVLNLLSKTLRRL